MAARMRSASCCGLNGVANGVSLPHCFGESIDLAIWRFGDLTTMRPGLRQLALGLRPIAVAALVCVALPLHAEVIDRVLAVVGSQVVTLSDARAVIEFGLVQPRPGVDPTSDAIQYLVNRQLMLSEVDRYSSPSPDAGDRKSVV